ncbi:TetR/AcrR family transcriptional regulator; helix-turn-helix transcriptional regulator [Corynebacterium sp. TAE3-ERU12]|uniref:TetR/AcrR family transcriptional regulator n=1 Tax=Corynebacterium sp. TAE3-ERU12 TaxID=2849491 RepID=UPI001C46EA81|nr:TetR/AcrR family transcriptional regulator [Corynebacterium sp. TAE3-ERU12]MBV7294793.1 TetR/AcrR family transcriptional regulator; helix-turn-helix transcriptional regulator [Corynebacterium sp. TAE3-ERU12]
MTNREQQRQRRHREIITAAASIIADRGFRATRLEDVGKAVGISGPALYRYVGSKEDLLFEILMDISVRLNEGAQQVLADADANGWDAEHTLRELLAYHVDFAVSEPDRIRVQEREIGNLDKPQREKVRALQRAYLDMWVDTLIAHRPRLDRQTARVRTQLLAGLINSSRHILHWAGVEAVRSNTLEMVSAVIDAP